MSVQLVVPMSGQGTRFREAGYTTAKPLIPISGVPMIQRLLSNFPLDWPCHFIMAENHKDTGLPELLRQLRPDCRLYFIEPHQLGPSYAVTHAIPNLKEEAPLFISYCDYGMIWDALLFERWTEQTQCDAALISYRGFHPHYLRCHRYAYSRLVGERVMEVKEKGNFTENHELEFASAGGYYFRTTRLFNEAFQYQKRQGLAVNSEYFTSLTVEALLRRERSADVRVFEIPKFFQWGTPEDVRDFNFWENTFSAYNRRRPSEVAQILMPMAGLGSRFQKDHAEPKPFVQVQGNPMFRQALTSLPAAKKTVVVTLQSLADRVHAAVPETTVVSLSKTPPGQALSTQAGLSSLNFNEEVLVSACDHGIVLDPLIWKRFRLESCDAAIFAIRDFPGVNRHPNSYAYIQTEVKGEFEKVTQVSVKKPLSLKPSKDWLLVGTFWFRKGQILADGIEELIRRDLKVNGEYYLDSVFELLIEKGLTVRVIPLSGYLCWGNPDALRETSYWHETFCGMSQNSVSVHNLLQRAA